MKKIFLLGFLLMIVLFSATGVSAHYNNNHHHWQVTPTPTIEVTPTLDPCGGNFNEVSKDVVDLCVTPTSTPSATPEPTEAPAPTTPPSPHGDGLSDGKSAPTGDGLSDGLGCGSHECKAAPTLAPCTVDTCGWK